MRQTGVRATRALEPTTGRGWLRSALQRQIRGAPAVEIARSARWTLNALAGGYARAIGPRGTLADHPEQNVYSVLVEGLESLLGLVEVRAALDDDDAAQTNYQYTADGRRYISMLSSRR